MTQEEMNVYKMRISQAGIGRLAVVMLDMEIQWIGEAMEASEDPERFVQCVEKARAVQTELMGVLNVENDTARDVYSVFAYINKKLIRSGVRREPDDLVRCIRMLERYRASFETISEREDSEPVMQGSEKIYAGLTYGAGGLVENSTGGFEYTV